MNIRCPVCGEPLAPNNRNMSITIKTINFPLKVFRPLYYCRNCKIGIDPANDIFNIYEGHKVTLHLAEEITRTAQKNSCYQEAKKDLEHYLGIKISESLIVEITEDVGQQLYQKELKQASSIIEDYEEHIPDVKQTEKENCTLCILGDGSMVSILEEQGAVWRENKLGLVFKDNKTLERIDGKNIITEKEYVSHLGGTEKFKSLLFKAAINKGYGTTTNVVFLGDGAQWLWNICDELFPDAVQILDYYHLKENVYGFAEYLHPNNEDQREQWSENILNEIEKGNVDEVIENLPENIDIEDDNNQYVPNLRTYLQNNKDRINYEEYRDQGFYIGSGAVESGHKKVIQQRLKQPGMHWDKDNCQSVASLRTKYCSDQWYEVKRVIYDNAA